jgi:amino acid adenylation domain-containing protein/non-ribosomal peptide synthase protein (TIGR01720 family)
VSFTLLTLSPVKRLLLVTLPSLCGDARTLVNLSRDVQRCYAAGVQAAEIADEPLQYADYGEWLAETLEAGDEEAAKGQAFWQEQHATNLNAPKLPLESRPLPEAEYETSPYALTLNKEVVKVLQEMATTTGARLSDILLTSWQTLLRRLTGETEFVVNVAFDGRRFDEMQDAFGLFARALPMRAQFAGNPTFRELLAATTRRASDAEIWQDYFIHREAVEAQTNASAPVGFRFVELPQKQSAGGARFSIERLSSRLEPCKLELTCVSSKETCVAGFAYDPARFGVGEIEKIARSFEMLLKSASENPELGSERLPIVGERERRQLLVEFNETTDESAADDRCIHQLFAEQAARTPARIAVVSEGARYTYAELNERANRLAHALGRRGVGPDVCVGLCLERSAEMVVGLLAILKAGGAYVALDADNPPARLAQQLRETQPPVLITEERFTARFPDYAGQIIFLERDRQSFADEPATNPESRTEAQHLAYVIFTSGSTGTPKGTAITHESLVNYTRFIRDRLSVGAQPADAGLHFALVSTFTADLGNTCLFPALVSGGCLHIISYEMATDAAQFAAYADAHPFDVLKITPSHLNALLTSPEGKRILPRKFLFIGGEALSLELCRRIEESAVGCEVINHYGPTETTVGSLTFSLKNYERGVSYSATVPIGRPISNTRVYVLDKAFAPVPVGVPGDLYIAGAGLARGYLKQPAQTAERFLPNPFDLRGGALFYRTGDVARFLPDGCVEFLGRSDHQVKIRGYRVELGEVEAVLKEHAQVRDALVLAGADESGHQRLTAYVVAEDKGSRGVAELRRYLKERLPEYMTPALFVLLDVWPLTANGKVDRAALAALPTQSEASGEGEAATAPRTSAEDVLAGIWKEVLGIERVGMNDNFFELGGDSILGIQIIAKANQAGFQLTPKQLFQFQTIAELAAVSGTIPHATRDQGPVTGDVPLTPLQLWFFEQQLDAPQLFNQAMLYEVEPQLDAARLAASVKHLVVQHDALRLRFVREDGAWRQFNAEREEGEVFHFEDISHLSGTEQEKRYQESIAEVRAGINLSEGPLMRVALYRVGANCADRLLVVCHYLAVDGFSWRILLENLQAVYHQLGEGHAPALPPKSTSFKAWAERLTLDARSDETQAHLEYWLAESRTRVAHTPVDFDEGDNAESSVKTVSTSLDADETAALLREVPAAYQTEIDDALLAALVAALKDWAGEASVLVDLESHGRAEALLEEDLSRTVGRLTHRAPAQLEMENIETPGARLKSVKEQLRGFREVSRSYGLLRYLSGDEATRAKLSGLPRAEIYFNYVGQLDQTASTLFSMKSAPRVLPPDSRLAVERAYLLDISAMIFEGQLQLVWEYSANRHQRSTVEQLAQSFMAELRAIIEHCQSPDAGGYTPSDFPDMDFNQQELDDLMAKLGA